MRTVFRLLGPLLVAAVVAGAAPAPAQPVENMTPKRCLLTVLGDAGSLPHAPLGDMRTKSGFSLGSAEGDVIQAGGLTARYYKAECDAIKFVFRKGRVVEIDGDPGAWC